MSKEVARKNHCRIKTQGSAGAEYGNVRVSSAFYFPVLMDNTDGRPIGEIVCPRKNQPFYQNNCCEHSQKSNGNISRIENNASDIRLSTLMRIVREGFGRHLRLSI